MEQKLSDRDIRVAAHRHLLPHAHNCSDTLVIEELGLSHGAVRIDIAVINGHIQAFEIKADLDSLVRLPRQVAAYGLVADAATLVATDRHLEKAKTLLPDWWGIVRASADASGVIFERQRAEQANPGSDPLTQSRLLWRPEVVEILRLRGADAKLLRAPRNVLYAKLVELTSPGELSEMVRTTLKTRKKWRDHVRPSPYGGSCRPIAMS